MLKIGEFSRLSQVTVKTLHHYDDIGLFKPVKIDSATNYRYYSVDQLSQVHRIMALKGLGLSLEQISLMLSDDLAVEQLRGMLDLRRSEIQQRLRVEEEQLQRVKFHLQMLEMEGHIPALDVIIKDIPSLYALTLRRSVTRENMVALGLEYEEVAAKHDIQLTGPVTEIRFEEEFQFDHNDVEFVWPVASSQVDAVHMRTFGTLQPKLVEGLPMVASYIIHGVDPKQYTEILPVFRRWIVEHGYQLCPSHRLVFHRGPVEHAEYKDWIIEFQHEIAATEDNLI